jgi:formylglycine-generating enzyme required for sulfatase activity
MGFIREREAFGMAEIFVRKFAEESLPKSVEWDARIWDERGVMKKRPSRTLCAILSFAFILMMGAGRLCAQTATANTLQHPKDQIALQLGAIQMGYTVPFTLTGNISVQKMQQAVNALVMGRNALDATVAKPAVKVVGAVDCPSVDTVEYRDQLYAAVEYVVTSPVVATIKGNATLTGNKKASVAATKLTVPPNAWTIPVPYALESRSSADVATLESTIQALRDELVAAGVLSGEGGNATADMVTVAGGTLPESSELAGEVVATFEIGKYEVTWGEWKSVRDWAVTNGYSDLAGVGDTYPSGSVDNFPVINVSWYDVVKWSNARSEKEGLTPVYQVSGTTYKSGEVAPTVSASANGYRLPSEKEWEWAARGRVSSQGYTYSGSNTANEVAWTIENSSGGSHVVGAKLPNELGIYDMSGNVWEWCEDVANTSSRRRFRGGSWDYYAGFAAVASRGYYNAPDARNYIVGFRLARSSGN